MILIRRDLLYLLRCPRHLNNGSKNEPQLGLQEARELVRVSHWLPPAFLHCVSLEEAVPTANERKSVGIKQIPSSWASLW